MGDPFAIPYPDVIGVVFLLGAASVLFMMVFAKSWTPAQRAILTLAISIPYLLHVRWALDSFPLSRILGTVVDLSLIPILAATSWGKVGRVFTLKDDQWNSRPSGS